MDFHIFLPLFLRTVTDYERNKDLTWNYKTRRANKKVMREQGITEDVHLLIYGQDTLEV